MQSIYELLTEGIHQENWEMIEEAYNVMFGGMDSSNIKDKLNELLEQVNKASPQKRKRSLRREIEEIQDEVVEEDEAPSEDPEEEVEEDVEEEPVPKKKTKPDPYGLGEPVFLTGVGGNDRTVGKLVAVKPKSSGKIDLPDKKYREPNPMYPYTCASCDKKYKTRVEYFGKKPCCDDCLSKK